MNKKKDGPNHPFLPNQTYFYEKNLNVYYLLKIYVSKIRQGTVNRYEG